MRPLLLAFIVLLNCQCNRSKEELRNLPAATQTGANTIGFKVNGGVWTWNAKYCPNVLGACRENPQAQYFPFANGRLSMSADKVLYKGVEVKTSESFDLDIYKNFNHTGTYLLAGIDSLFEVRFANNKSNTYYTLAPNRQSFEVNITKLDTAAKIVSGLFSGRLYNAFNNADSITLSEGRFDIKLQ